LTVFSVAAEHVDIFSGFVGPPKIEHFQRFFPLGRRNTNFWWFFSSGPPKLLGPLKIVKFTSLVPGWPTHAPATHAPKIPH
jgi:hypothetical protein